MQNYMDVYMRKAGVQEYWIVNVSSMSIEVYYLEQKKYVLKDVWTLVVDSSDKDYNEDAMISLYSMPHIQLALKDIFDGIFEE